MILSRYSLFSMFMLAFIAFSCSELEDPGALQPSETDYSIIDFDRLEMGSAFQIEVEQSSTFSVHVEGDRRNLNDLKVFKKGSTLVVEYDKNDSRRHETYITIRMPLLKSANFQAPVLLS